MIKRIKTCIKYGRVFKKWRVRFLKRRLAALHSAGFIFVQVANRKLTYRKGYYFECWDGDDFFSAITCKDECVRMIRDDASITFLALCYRIRDGV